VQLIEPKNDWDRESFANMIVDATSAVAPDIVRSAFTNITKSNIDKKDLQAFETLMSWNGKHDVEDIGATIYQRFLNRYLENTFKDELEETLYKQLLVTHLVKRSVAKQMSNEASLWWDDTRTDSIESKEYIVLKSFTEAISSLKEQLGEDQAKWQWGQVHTLENGHALGTVKALRGFFNVGPFSTGGTEEVIDNKAFDFNDEGLYPIKAGPSTRRVIDFSDIENSISILPTGQSGNPFSEHYDDQAEMYVNGEFRKMMMNKDEIQSTSRLLTIKQKK
jgi:penicillin amidase